jgi:hypothetical protein
MLNLVTQLLTVIGGLLGLFRFSVCGIFIDQEPFWQAQKTNDKFVLEIQWFIYLPSS